MAETTPQSTDKKSNRVFKLIGILFKFYFARDLTSELSELNKSLNICDKLTKGLKSKLLKGAKNPIKGQIRKNYLISLVLVALPTVVFFSMGMNIYKNPLMVSYVGVVFDRLVESMDGGFFIKYIAGIDLAGFYLWRFWFAILFALFIVQLFLRAIVLNNHEILKRTRELKICAIKGSFLKEDSKRAILWTPAGVLIDLENGDEESFSKSTEVWLQMSMFPGDTEIAEDKRSLIFIHTGQRLEESYAYFTNGVEDSK